MDTASDSSDGEQDLPVGAHAPVNMETGRGLKPQMDNIFAEVEKSLPSIDFDMSDMSSDSEEPVIFHRNLKVPEHDYDDEKDLDTSLSGESALDFFKSPPGMIHIPSVDKNNASLSDSSNLTFDNDLAALLAAQEVTTLLEDEGEENVSSWKDLERIARRDKQRQKEREQGLSPPPTTATTSTAPDEHIRPDNTAPPQSNRQTPFANNRQMGLVEAGDLLLAQLSENNRASGSSLFGGRTVDLDIVVSRAERSRAAATDKALSRDTNKHDAGTGMDDAFSGDMYNSDAHESKIRSRELDSNRELERIEQDRKAQEKKTREEREVKERRRKEEREELRRRDKELALSYMSAKAPNLSMQILDSIDLDTSLEDDNELARWSPPPSLRAQLEQQQAARVNAAPTTSSSSAARQSGRGDGDGKAVAGTENLTLIQKLAQFSLKQSGRDYDPSVIDPQTGADIGIPTTPRTTSTSTTSVTLSAKRDTAGSKTSSAGTSTTLAGSSTKVAVPEAAGVAGKESSGGKDVAPMAALLESLNKRTPEPDTVFIDLRGFEQHRKEEKERMTSVSRVLGLEQQSMGAESSDSEDEDKWLTQRQQVKRTITTRGSATPSFKQQRLKQAQPARVINLQKKTTSSRGVSTSSCGVSASLGATGDAGSDGASTRSTEDDSNLKAEEKAALLAREKEKERQKEAARVAREEKEKIRSARLRMLHHLESLHSTGAVSETKPCAENTPVLFDLEASYEPRLPVLPTSLDKEEVLLLTVNLSSNGEIALHNSRSSKTSTENVINALPKSYLSLICWLVSLIPHDFHLVKQWLECPEEGVDHYPEGFPPFHVIGLQQLLVDGNLCLAIAICPSPIFMFQKDDRRDRLLKKGKKGDETTRFYKFVDTFISRNSLSTVISWPRYLGNEPAEEEEELSEYQIPLTFSYPHLPFLGKPMSAYMQLHKDPGAVESIFNKDVGFFWQTVDSQESGYQYRQKDAGGENTPQNTLFLLSKQALFRPQVVHETLFRVVSQSLDISGLRVLYPSSDTSPEHRNINSPFPACFSAVPSPGSSTEGITPVLAVAVRGPHARIRLTSIIGPMDFTLAKKTDPYSLTALFGNPKTGLQIFCPRNLERAKTELVRWFGGRAPEKGSMAVGLPYKLKEYDYSVGGVGGGGGGGVSSSGASAAGRGKKGKRGSSGDPLLEPKPSRPPAALTATTLSHVVMVISPIVPIWVLGFLVSLMQQKAAFQPRGIRRLCLSVKKANTLGVPSAVHSFFCPGVNLDVADIDSGKQQQESCSPCTLLLLERENASHHASSLVRILVNELKSENIVERMEDRAISKFDLIHLFHTTDYSDSLLVSLGGDFSKCPSFDPMCDMRGPMRPLYSNKELEQVVVLILLGKDLLKDWGSFLQKLQTFSTTNSWLSDFELLGMKWLAGMNTFQTREVTPYEIGDVRWRSSVQFLAHEPAVVFAIRGVNAFKKLEPFVCLPVTTPTTTIPQNSTSARLRSRDAPHPTRLMSRSPKETYMFVRLFFSAHELFPDPDSRMLLPCLPESRLYYDTLEWTELGNVEGSKPRILLKSVEEQDLTQENVPEMLLCDGIPLTTFLLIKPRAARKHLAKIVRRVLHEGFTIVGFRLDLMSSQLAERFLALEFENTSQLHDLHLEYLTSEPSIYMALCRENAVKKLRDLIGPEDPLQARRQNQFYWRGIYGADSVHNGLYASRTHIEAMWDQRAFFPDGLCCNPTYDLQMEQIPCPAVDGMMDVNFHKRRHAVRTDANLQDKPGMPHISVTEQKAHTLLMQTTCLVLPPSLTRRCCRDGGKEAPFEDILSLLLSRGFELVGARMVWMSQQQAEQFLHILHSGSFEAVSQLTCGPSLVLALERDNAVVAFESTLGTSEEAQTVISAYGKDLRRPADLKQASQLLALFFDRLMPGSQMEIQPVPAADTSSAHK
ncbi:dynein axonemal assembly factor 8-like [Littorina saxatilis]|uniref:Nucleoside diphosphate kinase-like domain-containing protein n=1 Tax=Littorina saxatilis TaxID=31220 RepID=A0AAN9BIY9_9CAEN